jgi:hypothetical protein
MRLFLTLAFFSLLFWDCNANPNPRDQKQLPAKADSTSPSETNPEQLTSAYQRLLAFPHNKQAEGAYFAAFPKTFDAFNKLFGYSNGDPLGAPSADFTSPLYDEALQYVDSFFTLSLIDKEAHCNRIIDICLKGRWYADAVNYFQQGMREALKKDVPLFSRLLSLRDDQAVKSFWYFYFDSPHPVNKLPENLLDEVARSDKRVASFMKNGLEEVQKAWGK